MIQPATSYAAYEIPGGIKVCCPADGRLTTPYILAEQGDWYEEELPFFRHIVRPSDVLIDVGANYGVYALCVAALCPQGRVWAYEPCRETAGYFARGIEVNGLGNVTLIHKAVSSSPGTGRLLTTENSELNALAGDEAGSGPGEDVELTTLDAERDAHGWRGIDALKIDTEGHDVRVLEGARRLLAEESPLVMVEIKSGASADLTPAEFLRSMGYGSYRLVPGLMALAPLDPAEPIDPFLTNALCCKPDRAAELSLSDRLVMDTKGRAPSPGASWPGFLRELPYAAPHIGRWVGAKKREGGWPAYEGALTLYAAARSPTLDIAARYRALRAAFGLLEEVTRWGASPLRLMSLARVAMDLGMRAGALQVLGLLLGPVTWPAEPAEPYLSPSDEFDRLRPGDRSWRDWAEASVLDVYEHRRAYSSRFGPPQTTLQIAKRLRELGFCTPGMERRAARALELAGGC